MSKEFAAEAFNKEWATNAAERVRKAAAEFNEALLVAEKEGLCIYVAINAGDKEDLRSTSNQLHSIRVAAIKSQLEF